MNLSELIVFVHIGAAVGLLSGSVVASPRVLVNAAVAILVVVSARHMGRRVRRAASGRR